MIQIITVLFPVLWVHVNILLSEIVVDFFPQKFAFGRGLVFMQVWCRLFSLICHHLIFQVLKDVC